MALSIGMLERIQPDPELLILWICPELTAGEVLCIRREMVKEGLKVHFSGPQRSHTEYLYIRTIRSSAHRKKVVDIVKQAFKKSLQIPDDPLANWKRMGKVSLPKYRTFVFGRRIADLFLSLCEAESAKTANKLSVNDQQSSEPKYRNCQTVSGLFLSIGRYACRWSLFTPWGDWTFLDLNGPGTKEWGKIIDKALQRIKVRAVKPDEFWQETARYAVLGLEGEPLPKPRFRDILKRLDDDDAWREWQVLLARWKNSRP